jgi:hypothetical protein
VPGGEGESAAAPLTPLMASVMVEGEWGGEEGERVAVSGLGR